MRLSAAQGSCLELEQGQVCNKYALFWVVTPARETLSVANELYLCRLSVGIGFLRPPLDEIDIPHSNSTMR